MSHFLLSVNLGIALVGNPMPATGQDSTVVFVHGLEETSSIWSWLIPDLLSDHPIDGVLRTTTNSHSVFSSQASQLATYLNNHPSSPNGIAAISHSNGGLVTREYVRSTTSPKINGHVSIGTPHHGAKLASSITNGSIVYWGLFQLLPAVWNPINYYKDEDYDWDDVWLQGVSGWEAEFLAYDLEDFWSFAIPTGLAAAGYVLQEYGVIWDVIPDMKPGSSFFSSVNSSPALSTEAQRLSRARVSISTEYPTYLAPFRAATEYFATPQLEQSWAISSWLAYSDLMNFAWQAYWYYQGHWDWDLRNNAWRWQDMYYTMSELYWRWEWWIGATLDTHDGIVPRSSSDYPGAGARRRYVTSADIHHNEQLDNVWKSAIPAFRSVLREAIDEDLSIEHAPPPAPPLSVAMSGPDEVAPGEFCTWVASASGGQGTGSYNYQWSGVASGSGSILTTSVFQQGYLTVTVTSGSETASAQMYIWTDEWAPPCAA